MLVAAVALAALYGCTAGATVPPANAEPPPSDYRAAVLHEAKATFFDPYSVRDARISTPRWLSSWNLGQGSGWTVCLRANAKNRMGAYIGVTDTVYLFRGGRIISSTSGEPGIGVPYYCGDAAYTPFPELERLE
jgi:hypothetical protein